MLFKLFPVALVLMAGAAVAQDPATPHPADKPDTPPKAEARTTSLGTSPARASDIIGTEIVDAAGKKVGEVEDLVISKDGKVCAIVDRDDGGLAVVPMDKLTARVDRKDAPAAGAQSTPDVESFTLAMDAAVLKSAPKLEDKENISQEWLKTCGDHYAAGGKTAAEAGRKPTDATAMATGERPTCVEKLIGKDVEATGGDDVGEIQDVAIDLAKGKIAYVVLSVGGVLGVGEKHHGVAFDRLYAKGDKFTLPATKQELKDKPGIDLAHLPSGPNLSLSAAAPTGGTKPAGS